MDGKPTTALKFDSGILAKSLLFTFFELHFSLQSHFMCIISSELYNSPFYVEGNVVVKIPSIVIARNLSKLQKSEWNLLDYLIEKSKGQGQLQA